MDAWVSADEEGVEFAAGVPDDSWEAVDLGVDVLGVVCLTVDEGAGDGLAVGVASGEAEGDGATEEDGVAKDVCVEAISGVLAAEGEDAAGFDAPDEAVISAMVA